MKPSGDCARQSIKLTSKQLGITKLPCCAMLRWFIRCLWQSSTGDINLDGLDAALGFAISGIQDFGG